MRMGKSSLHPAKAISPTSLLIDGDPLADITVLQDKGRASWP